MTNLTTFTSPLGEEFTLSVDVDYQTENDRLSALVCALALVCVCLWQKKEVVVNNNMEINDITYQINGAVFEVNRVLGFGFLEKVYENALLIEL